MGYFTFLVLRLHNLIYILHLQHISVWTIHISSAQSHVASNDGIGHSCWVLFINSPVHIDCWSSRKEHLLTPKDLLSFSKSTYVDTFLYSVASHVWACHTKGGGLWNPECSLSMWEDTSQLVLRINEIWWNLWEWSADNTARKTLNRDHILWEGARRDSTPDGRMKEALLWRWHWSLVMKTSAGGVGSKVGSNIQQRYSKGKSMGICH